jgi:hypothetical protein
MSRTNSTGNCTRSATTTTSGFELILLEPFNDEEIALNQNYRN